MSKAIKEHIVSFIKIANGKPNMSNSKYIAINDLEEDLEEMYNVMSERYKTDKNCLDLITLLNYQYTIHTIEELYDYVEPIELADMNNSDDIAIYHNVSFDINNYIEDQQEEYWDCCYEVEVGKIFKNEWVISSLKRAWMEETFTEFDNGMTGECYGNWVVLER